MKRAALYVRVSTQEQKNHGLSVDSQIDALQKYCDQNGYDVAGIYNDAGISARKSYKKRPELLRLISDCQNKKIDIVLFTKLDRFFRSVPDYYECIGQMAGVPWRAIWEDYETETSTGQFKVNIMLSVAQAEADRTSERIKAVKAYQKEQGMYLSGSAPTGYIARKGVITKDPETKDGIEAMFHTYLRTLSSMQAARAAWEHGVDISVETVRRLLRKQIYTGHDGALTCEPYITDDEYSIIQRSMDARIRVPIGNKRTYYFSSIVRCGLCGGAMKANFVSYISGGQKKEYKRYICGRKLSGSAHCPGVSRLEHLIEKELLDRLEFELYELKTREKKKIKPDMSAAKKKLKQKLQRIMDLYEDGDLTRDEYRAKRDQLKKELDALEFVAKVPKAVNLELPPDWKEVYEGFTEEEKKEFWLRTIARVDVPKDKKKGITIIFL